MADEMIPHMARAVITEEFEVWVVIDDLGFIGNAVEMGLIDIGTDEINPAVVFRLETEAPKRIDTVTTSANSGCSNARSSCWANRRKGKPTGAFPLYRPRFTGSVVIRLD